MAQEMHSFVTPNARKGDGDLWGFNNGWCARPSEGGSLFNILLSNNGNASQTHVACKFEDNDRAAEVFAGMGENPSAHPESLLDPEDPDYRTTQQLGAAYSSFFEVQQEEVPGDHPVDSGEQFIATQGSRGFVIYEDPEAAPAAASTKKKTVKKKK